MRTEDEGEKASRTASMAGNHEPSGSPPRKVPAEPWSLEAETHHQRIQYIEEMLELGAYWIPAEMLAPILMRIFLSMPQSGDFHSEP